MKRLVYLAAVALVALMILAPAAMAQSQPKGKVEVTTKTETTAEGPLPSSGGPVVGSVLLPAAALLVGSGVLVYSIARRRG